LAQTPAETIANIAAQISAGGVPAVRMQAGCVSLEDLFKLIGVESTTAVLRRLNRAHSDLRDCIHYVRFSSKQSAGLLQNKFDVLLEAIRRDPLAIVANQTLKEPPPRLSIVPKKGFESVGPFGWKFYAGQPLPIEEEQKVLRDIRLWRAFGKPDKDILATLNQEGRLYRDYRWNIEDTDLDRILDSDEQLRKRYERGRTK
jgi:hypothetical protein